MDQLSYDQFCAHLAPEALCSGSIFGALSPNATRFLLKEGKILRISAGEVLFNYGDSGKSFFVVCRGELSFYKQHNQRRYLTRTINFGEEIGFVAMIALHDHTGQAVASADSIVLEIDAQLFAELHQTFPMDFGLLLMNLARDLARVVRRLSDKIVDLGTSVSEVNADN